MNGKERRMKSVEYTFLFPCLVVDLMYEWRNEMTEMAVGSQSQN